MRVDHRAQPHGLRLTAGGLDLLISHTLAAAVANALGGEQLDDIGAVGLHLADLFADLLRRARGLVDSSQRGEHAGTGNYACVDQIANLAIDRRSEALHGSKSGQEGGVRVARCVKSAQLRSLLTAASALVQAVLLIEMPSQVDVGVDPSRRGREAG